MTDYATTVRYSSFFVNTGDDVDNLVRMGIWRRWDRKEESSRFGRLTMDNVQWDMYCSRSSLTALARMAMGSVERTGRRA